MKWLAVVAVLVATLAPSAAAEQQQEQRPWLWQCAQIGRLDAQWTCYVRMLLADLLLHVGGQLLDLPRDLLCEVHFRSPFNITHSTRR